jgi:F-type H+-transporting ATPase subunit delta
VANTARAKRYAQAVFQIAVQGQRLDAWLADLGLLAELQANHGVMQALETPNISFEDKAKLLKGQFPSLDTLAINLLNLLVERGRTKLLPGIFLEYQRLLDRHRGVERADVVTAASLTDEDREDIEKRLSALTGHKVTVQARVDPSIVGGIVARIEGKLLDGSTSSRLEAMRKQIAGSRS